MGHFVHGDIDAEQAEHRQQYGSGPGRGDFAVMMVPEGAGEKR